jgi:hypothetical protein
MAVVLQPHQVKLASGLDTLAGIWLLISAFLMPINGVVAWDLAIIGLIVAVLAAVRAFGDYKPSWPSWVNAVLGLWVLVNPWIMARTMSEGTMWNCVITGLIIIVLAVWSALASDTRFQRVP